MMWSASKIEAAHRPSRVLDGVSGLCARPARDSGEAVRRCRRAAWMVALTAWSAWSLAACGSVSGSDAGGDAGGGGGAGGDSAVPGPVSVTALTSQLDGSVDPTALVIFVAPDQRVVRDGLVSADGTAQAELPAGSVVHVLRVAQTSASTRRVSITSVTDVAPSDALIVGQSRGVRNVGAARQQAVTFTATAGATNYSVWHPCGSSGGTGTSVNLTLYASCVATGATFEVLAIARGDAGFTPRYARATVREAAGTLTLATSWSVMPLFALTVTGVPAGASSLVLQRSTLLAAGTTGPMATETASVLQPSAGVVSASLPYAPTAGVRSAIYARLAESAVASRAVWIRTDGIAAGQGIELSTPTLALATSAPRLSGHEVRWDQRDGAAPDVRFVTASFTETSAQQTTAYDWTVVDGGGLAAVALPRLPPGYADLDPVQRGAAVGALLVQSFDFSNVEGYRDARRLPLGDLATDPRLTGLFPMSSYQVHAAFAQAAPP
jgi:hypothetical protein